jgi:hypothetical protein
MGKSKEGWKQQVAIPNEWLLVVIEKSGQRTEVKRF